MKKIFVATRMAVALLVLMAICAPCLLIFSEGKDGNVTIWNFVGFAWCVGIYYFIRKMMRQ